MQAAAEQAKQEQWRIYRAGPELRADGKLMLPYVEGVCQSEERLDPRSPVTECKCVADLWAFSPAYPIYLESVLSKDVYWGVLKNVNAIIGAARDASGQANVRGVVCDGAELESSRCLPRGVCVVGASTVCIALQYRSDITGSMASNLAAGNIAALSNAGNIQAHVAKAQAATQAKEAAMIQVRQFLFLTNRESPAVQWNLDRNEYATRHYVSGHDGMPGRYETRWHVKFTIEITIAGGPSALPASAVTAGLSQPPILPPDALTEATWNSQPRPEPEPHTPKPVPAFVQGMAGVNPNSDAPK